MTLFFFEGWWEPLSDTEKIFWGIAIVFSVLFLIQFVVNQIGLQFTGNRASEENQQKQSIYIHQIKPGFSILSVRGIIAFFTFFGWAGVLTLKNGGSTKLALLQSSLTGLVAMIIVGFLIYMFSKYSKSNSNEISKTLYKTGKVFRSIPANKNGQGKVHINLRDSLKEVDAVTDGDALPTGSTIKVVEVLDNNLILVEPANLFI